MRNFENLWMKQKKELLEMIRIGKEEAEKPYDDRQYSVIHNGDVAEEHLIRMIKMECDDYFGSECNDDACEVHFDSFGEAE